jgi:hypothetical protein
MLQNQQQKVRYMKKMWKQRICKMRAKIQKITFNSKSYINSITDSIGVSDEIICVESSSQSESKFVPKFKKKGMKNNGGSSNPNYSIDAWLNNDMIKDDCVQNNVS